VRYRKSPPWAFTKNIIERNSYEGVQAYVDHVAHNLRKYLSTRQTRHAMQRAGGDQQEEDEDEEETEDPSSAQSAPVAPLAPAVEPQPQATSPASPAPGTTMMRTLVYLVVILVFVTLILVLRIWWLEDAIANMSYSSCPTLQGQDCAACAQSHIDAKRLLLNQARGILSSLDGVSEELRQLLARHGNS